MDTYDLFKQANEEWERGNSKKAFDLFLKAAELGESSAQHNVGYFYDVGEGVKKDVNKALLWYKKAWKNGGQTDTCINIAQLYASIGKNRRAIYWWKLAVDRNDGDAILDYARFYASSGKDRNKAKAIALLKRVKKCDYVSVSAIEESEKLLKTLEPL